MTEKLYYQDNMMKRFDAHVLCCTQSDHGYAVVLDRTAFFPEEGGQYSDKGTIDAAKVTDVREKDWIITHYTDSPLEVGSLVTCSIDFTDRFEKMQCHSGEHIVSGLILKHYGLNNVGFHLGHDDVTLDFDGVLSSDELEKIERLANSVVYENIEIKCEFPSPESLDKLEYRSKLELVDNVRIVTIDNVDICACCAPHVSRTGEIGIIKFLDVINYKGGIRIHMLCGARALRDYGERYKRNREISMLTSVKQSDVSSAVTRLLDECGRLKGELSYIKKALLEEKIKSLRSGDDKIVFFEKTLGVDLMREYATFAANTACKLCAVFCQKGENEYNYVIAARKGSKFSARDTAGGLKENFGARGGGNELSFSGSVTGPEEELREYIESI